MMRLWSSNKVKDNKLVNRIGKKSPKPKKEADIKPTFSTSLEDNGKLIEMTYSKTLEKTAFSIWDGENLKQADSYEKNGTIYMPFPASKDIVRNGTVLFASEPIDYGSEKELVHNVQKFIHKYLTITPEYESIAVRYVIFSWLYDRFEEVPYLRALGDYGSGKSRFLKTIGSICNKPIFTSGAGSVSTVFRLLEDYRGTLLIDEADMRGSDTYSQLVKILNSGFQAGTPVTRSQGKSNNDFDVQSFNVFGCKIVGARFHFDDEALESRFLTEEMTLVTMREDIPIGSKKSFHEEALELRNMLLMYRFKNFHKTGLNQTMEIEGIEPRLNQIAVPLMSTIEDPDVISTLQSYFLKCNDSIRNDRQHSLLYGLTEAVCALKKQGYAEPTIKNISDEFNKDSSFTDYKSPKKVGFFLRKYLGLHTQKTMHGFVIDESNETKIIALAKKYKIEL